MTWEKTLVPLAVGVGVAVLSLREGGREAGLSLRGEGGRLEVPEGGPEAGLSLRGEGGRLEVRDGVRSPLGEGGLDGCRSLRGEECL
jgi:hypothetical protein